VIQGRIFNIQRFSVHDGPGIRTTVFLKGCPLRCTWCHNPESLRGEVELSVAESRCIHCGQCVAACPTGRLRVLGEDGPTHWTPKALGKAPECTLCGTCVEVCPVEARQLVGWRSSVDELLAEVLKDRLFFDDSGGGVTFSGGEPLGQPEFLAAALDACRHHGMRTAVDTSGFCRQEDLLAVARQSDLFLYDLKHMDEERHRELTGVSNRRILENLQALAAIHDGIWIRVPLIPGVNDDAENLDATARFVLSLPGVRRLHLLPYHRHGLAKRERLSDTPGETDEPFGTSTPPPSVVDRAVPGASGALEDAVRRMTDAGLETHLGG